MNNGNRRRNHKRYRIRYDRIIAVVLVLVVLIVIITSCTKSCSKKDSGKDNSSSQSSDSVVDELTTSASADSNVSSPDTPAPTQPVPSGTVEFTTQSVDRAQVSNGDLILVNSLYPYKFQPEDISLATLYDNRNDYYGVSDNVVSLDSRVITQLNALMQAASSVSANANISVFGGYRTLEEQTDKFNSGTSKFQGGCTDYHTARTFDMGIFPPGEGSYYYQPKDNYAWIDENAANYGFILRFPEGKDTLTGESARTYTYRYVGVPHAVYIKQNNLCLEEYIETVKTYTNTSPLQITAGTAQYQVYYAAANGEGATDVPVPSQLPYTISGNNIDGFIITVSLSGEAPAAADTSAAQTDIPQ